LRIGFFWGLVSWVSILIRGWGVGERGERGVEEGEEREEG
jgi:hypothetical protein